MQANHLNINLFKTHLIVTDMSAYPTFAWSGHSSLYFFVEPTCSERDIVVTIAVWRLCLLCPRHEMGGDR